jgi:autotransporter-associated beta strand protein
MEIKQSQLSLGRVSRPVMWSRLGRRVAGHGLAVWCLGLWLLASLLPGMAMAQTTLTWGVGGAGGSGTWSGTNTNWYNGASNVAWSANNNAVFAGTSGTVTLGSNNLTANSLLFNTSGYTLAFGNTSGGRTLIISSLGGSALGSTTFIGHELLNTNGSVSINVSGNTSFSGIVANNGTGQTSFSKSGTGRLTLAEGFNYTASGNFSIAAGSVRLGTTSNLPSRLILSGSTGVDTVLELAAGNVSRDFSNFRGNGLTLGNSSNNLGFAAIGADRILTMANPSDVTWGVAGDGFLVSQLILSTADSTNKLTFAHQTAGRGLRFTNTSGTTTRTIRTDNGLAEIDAEIAMPLLDGTSPGQVGAFTKTGAGVLALAAVNTYTGPTTVSAGGLLVNGTTAAASAFSVSSGAFLGGIGRVGGDVTVNGGIAPGSNGIGTLTTGSGVTWNSGNAWLFQLGNPAASLNAASSSTDNDLLNVAGAFNSGTGSTFTFDFANTGSDGWYKLIDYTTTNFATGTNTSFTANNVPSGKTANFVVDSASSALYVQIVPEPSTIALAAFGALTCLWACRRRRTA